MITLAYWQLAALLAVIPVAFMFGVFVMAWVAMARYDGDEMRSEEE